MNKFNNNELIERGILAAKAGNVEGARFLFRWALDSSLDAKQRTIAWYWLSKISENKNERLWYLRKIATQIQSPAMQELLNGIYDSNLESDNDNQKRINTIIEIEIKRFYCPQCGSYLSSSGNEISCAYCGYHRSIEEEGSQEWNPEILFGNQVYRDEKSNRIPLLINNVICSGCGVSFLVKTDALSFNCPYCSSTYAIEGNGLQEFYLPQGIIPFTITQATAERSIATSKRDNIVPKQTKIDQLIGIYLPIWSFDIEFGFYMNIGGMLVVEPQASNQNSLQRCDDIYIPASQRLSPQISDEIDNFDKSKVVPYRIDYLANQIAEIYQISPIDASREAKYKASRGVQKLLRNLPKVYVSYPTIQAGIDSFKLILLPFWLAKDYVDQQTYRLIVNGQTGKVRYCKQLENH